MNKELRIKLFSYDQATLDQSTKNIIKIARDNNCDIKGPIYLPTRKQIFTILRAPHVNKPSMEQFEKRTHKRLIILSNTNPKVMDNLKRLNLPSSVEIQIQL